MLTLENASPTNDSNIQLLRFLFRRGKNLGKVICNNLQHIKAKSFTYKMTNLFIPIVNLSCLKQWCSVLRTIFMKDFKGLFLHRFIHTRNEWYKNQDQNSGKHHDGHFSLNQDVLCNHIYIPVFLLTNSINSVTLR